MLFIIKNNIKIILHGLIKNLISNGSHTIIFHIIQISMLTHQLACINISFSNTHFKPFNSTITVLFFIHHSCSSCQATTYKQSHMDHFGPTTIRTIFNSPNRAVGCPWAALSPSIGSTLWNRESMAISGLTHTQNNYYAFLNKEFQSKRKPLPPEVVKTPQNRCPHIALAVESNFASRPTRIRWSDRREI